MAQTMTIEQMEQILLALKQDVDFLKKHFDEVPKEEYVQKIRTIEKRANFSPIDDFSKEFGL